LPLNDGSSSEVQVTSKGPRHFSLSPWPFEAKELTFSLPARHVDGKTFSSSHKLEEAFLAAPEEELEVILTE